MEVPDVLLHFCCVLIRCSYFKKPDNLKQDAGDIMPTNCYKWMSHKMFPWPPPRFLGVSNGCIHKPFPLFASFQLGYWGTTDEIFSQLTSCFERESRVYPLSFSRVTLQNCCEFLVFRISLSLHRWARLTAYFVFRSFIHFISLLLKTKCVSTEFKWRN